MSVSKLLASSRSLRTCSARATGDEGGQALILVLGLVVMIWLGSLALVQNVDQHYPIVEQDVTQHEAYRAMQAGISEYMSLANATSDYADCDSTIYTGYPGHWANIGQPSLPTTLCTGLTFGSWTSVPNNASSKGPPAWFLYKSPSIYYCTGTTSQCPATVWDALTVVGASGYNKQFSYDTGTVTLQPANGFLLNLWWLNYDQEDPTMNGGTSSDCNYYWDYEGQQPPAYGLDSSTYCNPVDFITGESLTGNVFSNDSIFICGSPTISGNIDSADPNATTVYDPSPNTKPGAGADCTDGGYPGTKDMPVEPIPTDDAVLNTVAAEGGCVYEGPTEINLAENGSIYEMQVYSPDTPTGSDGTTGSNDKLNYTGNANPCMPTTGNTWVTYPTNGVVFVENCLTGDTACTGGNPYNPLNGLDWPDNVGSQSATTGDAIVQGTVSGPLTIAAQNNVVIAGNLCYAHGAASCGLPPAGTASGDVLGLIALNYIELNHPMADSRGQASGYGSCAASNSVTMSSSTTTATTALECDLQNPIIDAALLALNQQFFVNNYDQGNSNGGNIYVNGAISEDWRGPVGQGNYGYNKQYTYDQRLSYLSPPHYLNPGTASWALASISSNVGPCPTTVSGCSTIP